MNLKYLYVTADKIGTPSGGGVVTYNESQALKELGSTNKVWDRDFLSKGKGGDPWLYDNHAAECVLFEENTPRLAHFYSGTFSKTVNRLKSTGSIVTYTAAAHDIAVSRKEHKELELCYGYPHINEPELWEKYVRGYLQADVLIVPSSHSANVMLQLGARSRIEIIPHGIYLPKEEDVRPHPNTFRVGYLGAIGPDKGIRYLLEAWGKLNYKDATLVLAGRDSISPFMLQMINHFGGGNIELMGWVDNIKDFYNYISLYVQPSVTEGFGIEVLEAMSYRRPVLCSDGAGACDVIDKEMRWKSKDVNELCEKIGELKKNQQFKDQCLDQYTWDKIKERYKEVWRNLCDHFHAHQAGREVYRVGGRGQPHDPPQRGRSLRPGSQRSAHG